MTRSLLDRRDWSALARVTPVPQFEARHFVFALALLAALGFTGFQRGDAAPTIPPETLLSSVPVHTGYRDFNFGSTVWQRPTSEKPQSKLWWHDGLWWGCLWDPVVGSYRIHRLDASTQTWLSDGPNADNRTDALVDVLWAEPFLYILSHRFDVDGPFRVHSYTYDSGSQTYAPRPGFPVDTNSDKAGAVTIAKDTTGKLWITWEDGGDVWINCSLSSETDWGSRFRLPVQGNDTKGDISVIASFSGRIGVLWGNQNDQKVYFATHIDGNDATAWESPEEALVGAGGSEVVDDHLNVAVSADGSVYAISKTGLPNPTDPRLFLMRRDPIGTWTQHVVSVRQDDHSRPIVVVDDENRKIYVFAKSDADVSGHIRMKTSDMDNIAFESGSGTIFMHSVDDDDINDPTSTKQALNGSMNLLVAASDEGTRHYLHNWIDLPGDGTPVTDIAVVPLSNDFGTLPQGSNLAHTFTVQNVGTLNLDVSSTSLAGADPGQFAISSGGGAFTLVPGDTRDIVAVFAPSSLGVKSAVLRIRSNDPNEDPFDVALSGTCIVAGPDITITPASYDFGSVQLGTTATQTFEVRNDGSIDLDVTSVALVDPGSGPFDIIGGAGTFTLAPGSQRDVIVRFNPGDMRTWRDKHTIRDAGENPGAAPRRAFKSAFAPPTPGPNVATLRIESDDPDESQMDITLTGTGVMNTTTGTIVFEESVSGGSSASITVSTDGDVTAVDSHLYLAAIATKRDEEVASVTGMGLTWTRVIVQCGGRHQTGIEVWQGSGYPNSGPVTATMSEAPDGATIIVSRYSGADRTTPFGNVIGANTYGVAGPCDDGIDSAAYAVPMTTTTTNAMLFTAVAMRDEVITVAAPSTRRGFVRGGSGGGMSGLAVIDQTVASPTNLTLEGTFDEPADWSLVAIEIRAAFIAKQETNPIDPIQEVRVAVSGGWGGRASRIEFASPRAASLHAAVYDVRGRLVRTLFHGTLPAGRMELLWNETASTSRTPTGVYFLRAVVDGRVFTRRIVRVR